MADNNKNLNEKALAAALAEFVYMRNNKNFGVDLEKDLGFAAVALGTESAVISTIQYRDNTITRPVNSSLWYNPKTGFGAAIVAKENDTAGPVYVVLRGTDTSESALQAVITATLNQTIGVNSNKSDTGDLFTNKNLGSSTSGAGGSIPEDADTRKYLQLQDAIRLTYEVTKTFPSREIVIVGQSLGGGLAGLVGKFGTHAISGVNSGHTQFATA